jgi:hypothetical protein
VGTRPILGVSSLRSAFLDDVPATQPRQNQTNNGAGAVTNSDNIWMTRLIRYSLDDDIESEVDDEDDDDDEDDEIDKDTDEDDDGEDEEEDDEDEETWQVSGFAPFR